MFKWLYRTENDFASLVLRLVLGVLFVIHGSQKVFGAFGGPGPSATITGFGQLGLPTIIPILVMIAEFAGGILLIVGFLTRLAALGIGAVMVGAIWFVHLPNGLFMNWMGTQKGEGYEFHILVLAIAFALLIRGGGMLSVDRSLYLK